MAIKSFNLRIIEDITKGNSVRIIDYINLYIDETSRELNELGKYFEEKNWAGVERIAHKMKAAAGYMGIAKLQKLSSNIEKFVSSNDIDIEELSKQVRMAVKIFESVKIELIEEKKRLTNRK